MSGPIVRKYGFPNFEKIFGERPLQHGQDEPAEREKDSQGEAPRGNAAPTEPTKSGDSTPSSQDRSPL